MTGLSEFTTALTVAMLVMLYFLPSIIAGVPKHKNFPALLVLNILLAWTLLCALIWSLFKQ